MLAKDLVEKVNVSGPIEVVRLLDNIEHKVALIIERVGEEEVDRARAFSLAIRGGTKGRQSLIGDLDSMVSSIFRNAADLNNQHLNLWDDDWVKVRAQAGHLFEVIAECASLKNEAIKESEDFFV